MPRARVGQNGHGAIEIEYEVLGEGEPLVLVMGLGAQLIYWHDALFELFAARGFRAVRFDNRDVGLSTRFERAPVPDLRRTLIQAALGLRIGAPYDLGHMAE